MSKNTWDCIIIGGGASGLAAAAKLKSLAPNTRVLILEKNTDIGKKLRATGNGRCNLTNKHIPTVDTTVGFFENILGIPVIFDKQGRGYPFSESAAVMVEAFRRVLTAQQVEIITEAAVNAIDPLKNGDFLVKTNATKYRCKNVILAVGGKAGPQFGCSGDGYAIAESLGHSVNKTIPVLSGVMCDVMPKTLEGFRVKGSLCLTCDDMPIFTESGEIQMTAVGLSGICVFNLSRHLKYLDDRKLDPYRIHIDLNPDHRLDHWLSKAEGAGVNLAVTLKNLFKAPIADVLIQRCGDDLTAANCIAQLHDLDFKPTGVVGFKTAQCTSGGIPFSEIDPETMQSKLMPGLYFTGEITDYDGPCGGFNLDHAWQSGMKAALSISNQQCAINEEIL